jgi:ubiquinone biosynthesis protein
LAKLLPELPRMVHAYLSRDKDEERRQLLTLIQMQQRTNRTLQTILLLCLGFFAGLVITALLGVWSLAG